MKQRHTLPRSSPAKYRKHGVRPKPEEPDIGKFGPNNPFAVALFEPDPAAVYPIEVAARMAGMPRRIILVYCKHRLVSPLADPAQRGYWFAADAIRTLRRIGDLRLDCIVTWQDYHDA